MDDPNPLLIALAAVGIGVALSALVWLVPRRGRGDAILGAMSDTLITIWRFPLWLGILLAPLAFIVGTLLGGWWKGL